MLRTHVSVLTDKRTGEEVLQWDKYRADADETRAVMEETLSAFMEPLNGLAKPTRPPSKAYKEIFTEYILTDLHLGQYSWDEETGDSYDIRIADETARAAIDRLIDSTPPSEKCLINQMGDFFHADGNVPLTPTGKNVLDTDTRHRKVMWVGVYLLRYAIEQALHKHKVVEIRNTTGNHDIHSGMVLDVACQAYFEREPRVVVHESPRPFWAYTFGSSLVGISHGDAPKPKAMPGMLAHDYPEEWGVSQFKYCRHGHLHSTQSFEEMGVICEGFRTLAPKDAWHAARYRSGREAVAIVLDKDYGEIERHTAGIKRVMDG